jgi:hypothetical protein
MVDDALGMHSGPVDDDHVFRPVQEEIFLRLSLQPLPTLCYMASELRSFQPIIDRHDECNHHFELTLESNRKVSNKS